MKIFNFLKKRNKLSNVQKKVDKLWDLWVEGQVASPYKELMTYQSEINNGGHNQYFSNTEEIKDLKQELLVLDGVLPDNIKSNLHEAYAAYLILSVNENDEKAENVLRQCDLMFYENQESINNIINEYAIKTI